MWEEPNLTKALLVKVSKDRHSLLESYLLILKTCCRKGFFLLLLFCLFVLFFQYRLSLHSPAALEFTLQTRLA